MLERIHAILESCGTDAPHCPPTLLYNEGWMLRWVLDWFSSHPVPEHPLDLHPNSEWFSEALLPSAFLARYRGDQLAESWTHADGVIGHFQMGTEGKAALSILPDASHFVVVEAKLLSSLSSGVRNARYFDQVARNVACIAEVFHRAKRMPSPASVIGFYVLAPQSEIGRDTFQSLLNRESIQSKVRRRVDAYEGIQDEWYTEWFEPIFGHMTVACLSWEEVIQTILHADAASGQRISEFYNLCLHFNQ